MSDTNASDNGPPCNRDTRVQDPYARCPYCLANGALPDTTASPCAWEALSLAEQQAGLARVAVKYAMCACSKA